MIKKYRNIILTNASIIGFSLNNVKAAADTNVYVNIGEINYFEATKGKIDKSKLKDLKGLINELESLTGESKLKKDGSTDQLELKDILKEYFVKSVKVGNSEKLTGNTLTDIHEVTMSTDDNNKLIVELVKKEDRINITYDETLKGARLTKESEGKILAGILQGKKNTEINALIGLKNLKFNLGGNAETDSTKIIGNDVNLFADNNKIDFEITKLPDDGFKTVVCKFADGVKTVEGLKFDNYIIDGLAKSGLKISEIIAVLNNIDLLDSNNGKNFFKNDAKFKALKDGTGSPLESTNTTGADFSSAKFIVLSDIKEADINPVFLKKTFKVELDKEGNNDKKVESNILETIENNLKTNLGDKVVITVENIINIIKASTMPGDSSKSIFVETPFTNLDNVTITGVATGKGAKLADGDTVNSAKIKISIKAAEFAANVVKTEFTITYDNFDNKDVNGKKVKQTVINAIKGIIDSTTSKITKAEFIKKFNDATAIARSSDFAETDFGFLEIELGSDIVKSGKIDIKEGFWSKLKDECFDAPAKPKGGDKSNGSGDPKGDEKPKKRCCNSNK